MSVNRTNIYGDPESFYGQTPYGPHPEQEETPAPTLKGVYAKSRVAKKPVGLTRRVNR